MAYTPPVSITPSKLNIPDNEYAKLMQLLELSRIGPLTYEASQQNMPNFGVTHDWITNAKDYWLQNYDWRAKEKYINSFPNYTAEIEGFTIHFVAIFSENKDAVPITLLHGWPGSFIEFLPMIKLLKKKYLPKDLPYHLIIPSIPGYTLSGGGPLEKEWSVPDSARIMHNLMLELGFNKYIAHGGDVGSFLATTMAVTYEQCVGLHLNFIPSLTTPEEGSNGEKLSVSEKQYVERKKLWARNGYGYAIEHGTRPATIGFVVNSNPLSLLACFPRSFYPYQSGFNKSGEPRPEFPYITKPLGFSWFTGEMSPGFRSAVAKHGNLVFHQKHDRGGHFAALERPREMMHDIEEFIRIAWQS